MIIGHRVQILSAFQNKEYVRLWLSAFFSYVSQMVQTTTLAWFVLERTDSPFYVALVGVFAFTPTFVLGVFGGLLADRIDRVRLLYTTQAVNLMAALTFLFLAITDRVEFWHAYPIISVVGIGWTLDFASRRSLIHDCLGDRLLTNGMALEAICMHSSKMIGPMLAGFLISQVGNSGVYGVVVGFYLVSIAMILSLRMSSMNEIRTSLHRANPRIPVDSPNTGTHGRGFAGVVHDLARDIEDGFRYAIGHKTIRGVIFITLLMNLLLYPYMQMVPVIARDTLGAGPVLMGVLLSAAGAGSVIGAVFIAAAGDLSHQGRVFVVGASLAMAALLLFSFSYWYPVSLILLMILGLVGAGFGTMQATIIMLVARKDIRGRALGVMALAIGVMPAGLLVTGAVASRFTPSVALGINAGVGLGLVVVTALLSTDVWRRIVPNEDFK